MIDLLCDLVNTRLFNGIEPAAIEGLLACVHARQVQFKKGTTIIEDGQRIREFGIILSGHARSVKWDASDKMFIVTLLEKGSEMGVLLAARPDQASSVSVQTLDDVTALMIPFDNMLLRCSKNCPQHDIMLRNYIGIVAEKGLVLHERINCLLRPTAREKVLTYLLRLSRQQQSRSITIPLNRNSMANYLHIERSALSRELSRMKRDGVIDYRGNAFRLLDPEIRIPCSYKP